MSGEAPHGRRVVLGTDEYRVTDEAIEALSCDSSIYTRGDGLAEVVDGRLRLMPMPTLRERLTRAAAIVVQERGDALTPAHPPKWLVEAIGARGVWEGVRRVGDVVDAPTLRPDGTVIAEPGYDDATGTLYLGTRKYPPVPEAPTDRDVARAVTALLDPFVDVPWCEPSDRAAAMSAVLAVAARPAIRGTVPLYAIRGTTPGVGKGLVAQLITVAATGRAPRLSVAPADADEWRKKLLSSAIEGARVELLDDVDGILGSAALAAALTSGTFSDRLLGTQRIITAPLRAVWLATGNGLRLARDLGRRTVVVDLDAGGEHPEDRGGWKYPDVRAHVEREHPRLLVAALTLLRGHALAGRPSHGQPALGGFEDWDRTVRACVMWAGVGDPDGGRARLRAEGDADLADLRGALAAWIDAIGPRPVSVAEVLTIAERHAELRTALEALVPSRLSGGSLGKALGRVAGRIVDGLQVGRMGVVHGIQRWAVARVEKVENGNVISTPISTPIAPSVKSAEGGDSGDHCLVLTRARARAQGGRGENTSTTPTLSTPPPRLVACHDESDWLPEEWP